MRFDGCSMTARFFLHNFHFTDATSSASASAEVHLLFAQYFRSLLMLLLLYFHSATLLPHLWFSLRSRVTSFFRSFFVCWFHFLEPEKCYKFKTVLQNTFCIVFLLSAFFAIVYIVCSSSSNTSFKHMYAIWKYTFLMCGVFPVYFLFDFLSLLDMTNVNENEFWLLK